MSGVTFYLENRLGRYADEPAFWNNVEIILCLVYTELFITDRLNANYLIMQKMSSGIINLKHLRFLKQ